jgi:hypothetical protein
MSEDAKRICRVLIRVSKMLIKLLDELLQEGEKDICCRDKNTPK